MGKQINYWMGYEDFLQIAQSALDNGCIIMKKVDGKYISGQDINIITEDIHTYMFYLREAGEMQIETVNGNEYISFYSPSGNTVVEAGFSYQRDDKKEITRARLFVTTGYYDKEGIFISRPDCLTKIYNQLVRVVKRVAPYTELTDSYISRREIDYLQEVEWKHKEYVAPSCFELWKQHYKLCQ